MSNITLRPATESDSEFAFETKRAAFKPYVEEAMGWDEDAQRRRHTERFRSQNFRIIHKAGMDVGVVAVVEEPHRLKLNQIFIKPEYHSQGIGSFCLKLIIDEATESGKPIELRVLHNNPRAIAFYQRLGFTTFDRSKTHLHMRKDVDTK